MNFELRVAGPDTVDVIADELEALRLANAVNKQYLADCAAHPGNEVLCVATVHMVEQVENLPELPTCTKSQTADVVGVIPTISMRHVDYDDGTHGVELTVTGLTSEQQAEAAMLHIQRLFCGEEISEQ